MKRFIPRPHSIAALVACWAAVLLVETMAVAHETGTARTRGQTVYLPIYSTIAHWTPRTMNLTVTLSVRNVDAKNRITLHSIDYFDTNGVKKKSLLEEPKKLPPFGSAQFIIGRDEFQGDVGANAVVSWRSNSDVAPPLIESIMIGSDGAQAYSFSSRGALIEKAPAQKHN